MKRFFKILKPHLRRPIAYSVFLKLALSLCAALLWNRYVTGQSTMAGNHLQQSFFFLTVYFILWTWLQYLSLDGMRSLRDFFAAGDADNPRPNMPFRLRDLINADVDAFEGLEDNEKTVCRMSSNAILAVIFLAAYLFTM